MLARNTDELVALADRYIKGHQVADNYDSLIEELESRVAPLTSQYVNQSKQTNSNDVMVDILGDKLAHLQGAIEGLKQINP